VRDYPKIVVPPPGPKAKAIVERDEAWAARAYIKEYPLVIAGGRGPMVEDVDGNRFLDFMAGIAVSSTGYNHPTVVKAVQDAAGRFLHICGSDFYFESMAAKCLIVGQCPAELRDVLGYDPVIAADPSDPAGQIRHILAHVDDYQSVVDRNHAAVLERGTWDVRTRQLLAELEARGYRP